MDRKRELIEHFNRALEDPGYQLPEPQQTRLERLKAVFARWMENPLLTDTMMRNYIMTQYGLRKDIAYQDIAIVKACFGNAPQANKEFQRLRANHLLEQASAAAIAGDEKQAKALTAIAQTIAKVNRLDEPEGEEMPWDEIVPKDEAFSVDPEVIGIKKVPGIEEKARKLLERYSREIDDE